MDADGFPLSSISEKSIVDSDDNKPVKSKRGKRARLRQMDLHGSNENGDISTMKYEKTTSLDTSIHSERSDAIASPQFESLNHHEVISVHNEYDEDRLARKTLSEQPSQLQSEHDHTRLSSYTAGSGENDVIEIHQFSTADLDAYLDIYFNTLDNRLRHYIGQDEQLRQFRDAMKKRINSNPNAREYQNVLLGKMNGEVLAAVTMAFSGEPPTVPLSYENPAQNSCLRSIQRWLVRRSNYVPANTEECYIEMLGVKNDYQNHGIGSAMLECVEHFARQAGAKLLTVHVNGARLRTYFERYGFTLDHTDNSGFWKWIVERQGSVKLSKPLLSEGDNDYTTGGYTNESVIGSVDEL